MTPINILLQDRLAANPVPVDSEYWGWLEKQPGFSWRELFRGEKVKIEGEVKADVWLELPRKETR